MEEVTALRKDNLLPSISCRLCNNTFRNATTIIECLHTFCRECIEKKLIDEELNHCPTCKVDLGCSPLDKLRTDNNYKSIQRVLLTSEGKPMTAEYVPPSTPLVTKKRRNSQSFSNSNAKKAKTDSKIVEKYVRRGKKIQQEPKQLQEEEFSITPQEPKVPASEFDAVKHVKKDVKQGGIEILDEVSTILSARRAKVAARKRLTRTPTTQLDKVAVGEKKDDRRPWLKKVTETPKIRFKSSSKQESSSKKIVFKNVSQDNAKSRKEKAAVCEPLNWLVETLDINKSPKNSNMQESGAIPMLVDSSGNDSHHVTKFEVKKHCNNHQTEAEGDENESVHPKSASLKFKLKRVEEKSFKFCEDLNLPAPPESESEKEFGSFWFSLVASKDQELGALPQLSSPYLRVKDGSLPVSHIKKYIVQKLNLVSEDEVEILLGDKPVLCSMQLQDLMEMWLETMAKNEMIETSVGESAEDFVMVLSYRRKA